MKRPSRDPITNAINDGIRRDINVAIDNECFRAAVILIFAGIDAMAHMNRPPTEKYNDSTDFKNWVQMYFHVFGQTTVTPEEWWAVETPLCTLMERTQDFTIVQGSESSAGWLAHSLTCDTTRYVLHNS